jgi:hypothetical protein
MKWKKDMTWNRIEWNEKIIRHGIEWKEMKLKKIKRHEMDFGMKKMKHMTWNGMKKIVFNDSALNRMNGSKLKRRNDMKWHEKIWNGMIFLLYICN